MIVKFNKLATNAVAMLFVCLAFLAIRHTYAQLSGCDKNPCQNNGQCREEPALLYGYKCICPSGFTGYNCDKRKSSSDIINGGNSNNNNNPSSGGGINIGGNGGSGGISIGSDGTINIPGSPSSDNRNTPCLNGGVFVRKGLPCRCPTGFSGNRCEKTGTFLSNRGCSVNPCYNRGVCKPTNLMPGYQCLCPYGYSGSRCEYFRRGNNRILGISIGSILPFLCFIACVGGCIYCCCFKNRNAEQSNNRFVPNMPNIPNFFNNSGPQQQVNRPFQPVYANNHQRPATYGGQPMPDPDEVFKTNSSPPPYESVIVNKPT